MIWVRIAVVVGGVIPAQDYKMLKAAGVAAIYGPGTAIPGNSGDSMPIKEFAGY